MEKKCKKCGESKQRSEFYKLEANKDGLMRKRNALEHHKDYYLIHENYTNNILKV